LALVALQILQVVTQPLIRQQWLQPAEPVELLIQPLAVLVVLQLLLPEQPNMPVELGLMVVQLILVAEAVVQEAQELAEMLQVKLQALERHLMAVQVEPV
jgi:hypothetical protein